MKAQCIGAGAASSPRVLPSEEPGRRRRLDLRTSKPIVVVSVIGVQSSGKSTLLNYLFGCEFETHAGRCTKGLFISLLETHDKVRAAVCTVLEAGATTARFSTQTSALSFCLASRLPDNRYMVYGYSYASCELCVQYSHTLLQWCVDTMAHSSLFPSSIDPAARLPQRPAAPKRGIACRCWW